MLPEKPNRFVSIFVVVCFVTLQIPLPLLAQSGQPRRVGLFMVPHSRTDKPKVDAVRGLITGVKARLAQQGVQVSFGAVPRDPSALEQVKKLIEKGKVLLAKNDGKAALDVYTNAERLIRKCFSIADRATIARVYKGLGVSFMMTGRMDMGQQMVLRSLVIYPNQRPKGYAFTLNIQNNLTLAKQQLDNSSIGSIEVKGGPAGAMIFVDREFKGLTPMTVTNLKAVDHLVEVIQPGYYEDFEWLAVVPQMSVQHVVKLQRAPVYKTYTGFIRKLAARTNNPATAQNTIASLADMFDLTDTFVMDMAVPGAKLRLKGLYYDGKNVKKFAESLNFDASLLSAISELIGKFTGINIPSSVASLPPLDAPPAAATTATASEEEEVTLGNDNDIVNPNSPIFASKSKVKRKKGITEKWWFWTIIGAVVVGGFTAGFLLMRGGSAQGPTGTLKINLHGVQ